jgi:drug/metabolite transporter (DMT)-like permease
LNTSLKTAEGVTPASAILLVFGAGILFTFLDTSAKYLVLSGFDSGFVTWVRFAVHALLVILLFKAWNRPARLRLDSPWKQVLRAVFMFGSTIFNFLALQTLQLAETVSIMFFGPMVITALAGPMLGEWAGWRRWLAVLVGLVGVLVITRPGFGAFGTGHLFALCAMLSGSLYAIMTRALSASETAESLIFYPAIVPVILLFPVVPLRGTIPGDAMSWVLLLALGFFGGLGHWLLIKAYRQATATALAPYPYLQMVWMIASGYLVFNQLPDRWTLIGAAIIVASGLYIVYREHVLRLRSSAGPNSEAEELAKKL